MWAGMAVRYCHRSKGPCDVFYPWVRWERGQIGICEFVRRRRLEIWEPGNLGIWRSGNLETWGPGNPEILRSGDLEIQKFGVQKTEKIKILKVQIRSAQNAGKVWISRKKIALALVGAI